MVRSPVLFGAFSTLALLFFAAVWVCGAQEPSPGPTDAEKVEDPEKAEDVVKPGEEKPGEEPGVPEVEPVEPPIPPALPEPLPGEEGVPPAEEGTMIDPVLLEMDTAPGKRPSFGVPDGFSNPDAFEDLEIPRGDATGTGRAPGDGGATRFPPQSALDSRVLRGELLPSVFRAPLEHEGIRFGIGASILYDTNLFLEEDDEVDDFTFTLSPSVEYRSAPPGVPGLATLRYTPFVRAYLDQSDLNTIDHAGEATVSFTGARGSVSAAANYGRISHADRYVGGLVETETWSGNVNASYQVGSRTSLNASLNGNFTEDSGRERSETELPDSSESDTMSMQLGGLWAATARTKVGPAVRYSNSSSTTAGDRDALAFLLVAESSPREGLDLGGTIGIEKVESDGFEDDGDTDFTGSLSVDYVINDRAALQGELTYQAIPQGSGQFGRTGGGSRSLNGNLSFTYTPNPQWTLVLQATAESFPSAEAGNYSVADQDYHVSVTRNLTNGSITLDGTLGFSSYESVGPVTDSREDETFRSLALRYRREVLRDRAELNAAAQWSQSTGNRDWDRLQLSLGLDVAF